MDIASAAVYNIATTATAIFTIKQLSINDGRSTYAAS